MDRSRAVTTGWAEVPGARLYYEMAGEGAPVIWLHGGLLDGRMWNAQFQYFVQQYKVVRYDERHSGKSEAIPSEQPYVHYQDLYHLMQALGLGLEKATLVGLSGGARIAIDMAIAYPEMVEKLVAVSPGLSGYTFVDEWTQQQGEQFRAALAQEDLEWAVEVFLTMWTYGPQRQREQIATDVRAHLHEMISHTLQKSTPRSPMHELEPPAIGRLHDIQAPLLIIAGTMDTSDIHAIVKQLLEQVAGSRLERLADVGHMLPMEKPEEFNELVEQFLI